MAPVSAFDQVRISPIIPVLRSTLPLSVARRRPPHEPPRRLDEALRNRLRPPAAARRPTRALPQSALLPPSPPSLPNPHPTDKSDILRRKLAKGVKVSK